MEITRPVHHGICVFAPNGCDFVPVYVVAIPPQQPASGRARFQPQIPVVRSNYPRARPFYANWPEIAVDWPDCALVRCDPPSKCEEGTSNSGSDRRHWHAASLELT